MVITRRTRNALGRNPSRVRISPSPPNPDRKLLGFLFESVPPRVALVFQSKLFRLAITAQVPTNPSLSAKCNLIRTQFGLGYFSIIKSFCKDFFISRQAHAIVPFEVFQEFYVRKLNSG